MGDAFRRITDAASVYVRWLAAAWLLKRDEPARSTRAAHGSPFEHSRMILFLTIVRLIARLVVFVMDDPALAPLNPGIHAVVGISKDAGAQVFHHPSKWDDAMAALASLASFLALRSRRFRGERRNAPPHDWLRRRT